MVFSSGTFLFFFLPVLLFFYYNPIFKGRRYRNYVLFIGSVLFYAWGEPVFVFLLLFSVAVNWGIGLLIAASDRKGKQRGKGWMITGVVWNLLLLVVFKYLHFLAANLGLLLHGDAGRYGVSVELPIGISFFTFQIMSYIIDVYRKKVQVQKNVFYVGMYIMMFPQLIAGPIVRYETVEDEILNRKETPEEFTAGIARFVFGLGKKALLANYLGQMADFVWTAQERSVLLAWIGAVAYTMQIYYDFSGYSDMAIGLGRMFGFHYDENFNYPYIAKSVTEFWRRWHISLSVWFRDYVYIPLGGNRAGKGKTYWNLFLVWLLTGIWHGANWTFVLWGLGYFVLLVIEKSTGKTGEKGISHLYTMFFVTLLWVLFRSGSIAQAGSFIGTMFGIGAAGLVGEKAAVFLSYNLILLITGVLGCFPMVPAIRKKLSVKAREWVTAGGMLVVFSLSVVALVAGDYNPFIYFNF